MIQKIKNAALSLTLIITCLFGTFAVNMVPAAALDCTNPQTPQEKLECGACATDPSGCPSDPDKSLQDTVRNIVNVISIAAGVVAVIMIILGGFRYITSGGNAQAVQSAKNTILYAIIGLVVIAFAQVIVRFVLHNTA
jgi:hypothetical protein